MLGRISKTMIALTALAMSQGGCDDDPIRAYQAPRDPPPLASPPAPAAHDTKIHWKAPEGWRQLSEKKPMRLATLIAGEPDNRAEIAVSAFPGGVGGLLANVNRWRGQVGLPPINSPEDQPTQQLRIGGFPTTVIDLMAPTGAESRSRIVVAMLHQPDRVWFFKMTGTHDAVKLQEEAFERFLHSVHFDKDNH